MRAARYLLAAAIASGLPATALAQPPAPPDPPATTQPTYDGAIRDHWTLSGNIGSNFSPSRNGADIEDESSLGWGLGLSYLWGGTVGAELRADFAPTFRANDLALVEDPALNAYMANLMAAVPLGSDGQVQPYFSGGVGVMQLGADLTNIVGDPNSGTFVISESRFGGNLGGGVMGFAGRVGFRADIRYFRTSVDDNPTATFAGSRLAQALLSGLTFWRANVGVALRW